MQDWVKALLHLYQKNPCLYELDGNWDGFEWINADEQTAAFTVLSVRVKMERTICCLYATLLRLPARITVRCAKEKDL